MNHLVTSHLSVGVNNSLCNFWHIKVVCVTESQVSDRCNAVETELASSVKCWNCGRIGQRSAQCNRPRTKHCFCCGSLT